MPPADDEPRGPSGEPDSEWMERLRRDWESDALMREWDAGACPEGRGEER